MPSIACPAALPRLAPARRWGTRPQRAAPRKRDLPPRAQRQTATPLRWPRYGNASRLDPARGAAAARFAGRGQSIDFGGTDLRRRGFRVLRRVVYTAVNVARFPAVAQTAIGKGLRAAMFFSTETAETFVAFAAACLWFPGPGWNRCSGDRQCGGGSVAALAVAGCPCRSESNTRWGASSAMTDDAAKPDDNRTKSPAQLPPSTAPAPTESLEAVPESSAPADAVEVPPATETALRGAGLLFRPAFLYRPRANPGHGAARQQRPGSVVRHR